MAIVSRRKPTSQRPKLARHGMERPSKTIIPLVFALSVVAIAGGCASRQAPTPVMPSPEITDARRTLAMVSIHARAYRPDADFSGTSILSLGDAVDVLSKDVGSGADSRVRRVAAELWIHTYARPEFRDAVGRLIRRGKSIDVATVDANLQKALAEHAPPIAFPPPLSQAEVVEQLVSNLLVGLTGDCPYDIPPPLPGSGIGSDPAVVSWSYDILIPRSLADIARTLDPQSWNAASTLFYDSYLVDTPPSCCPHTPSSNCTHTNTTAGDPAKGVTQPAGKPYAYCGFFEYFCAGPSCPLQGPSCVAAFKNLLCVRTQYEGAWVPLPCFANLATSYSVSYHLAESISANIAGVDPGPISLDAGGLSVRHATSAETASLPGSTWSVVHVDKQLKFKSPGMTAAMSQALQAFEKELHDQIVEQACFNVPASCWLSL